MDVDTVILAGGRGSRLRGVTPAGFKPLLVVDGKAMIVHVLEEAGRHVSGRKVIVLAPDNVAPIVNLLRDCELLDEDVRLVVQSNPTGPGDAFLLAADLCNTRYALVLAADNLFGEGDVGRVVETIKHGNPEDLPNVVVGGRRIHDPEIARRFTRITAYGSFEGPIEGPEREMWNGAYYVWLGPLIVNRTMLAAVLRSAPYETSGERKVGPHLWRLAQKGTAMVAVDCITHDVGDLNGG